MSLVARDAHGKTVEVALTHNDDFVSQEALEALLRPMQSSGTRLEASFIAGSRSVAGRALSVCDRLGAQVVFSAPNFGGDRIDDIAVDAEGKLYYGVPDLSKSSQMGEIVQRVQALKRDPGMALSRQLVITQIND